MGRVSRDFIDAVSQPPGILRPLSYRPKDAAIVLGVSQSTVYELIAGGKLEAKKIGGSTIIRHEALLEMLKALPEAAATKAAQASIK